MVVRADGTAPSSSLLDLRAGDADDNRTSPYGRGWRGVVVSTALDFNYLAASIAFLALIIVPALLAGLAVPLILTYGRQKYDAAVLIRSQPLAALGSLVVLTVLLLWIARPLWKLTVENLWHLHYTLVFPLFVCVRETISLGMERTAGTTGAGAALDRRRRLATILAAIILAGGGFLLVVSVGVLARFRLSDIILQPWTVTTAGLSNAAVLLGLSTAASSLYWMQREIGSRYPLRDWSPPARLGRDRIIRIAHLSDLHVVGERFGYRMECGTVGPPGNDRIAQALARLRAIHAAAPLDYVLVTGDVTDAGTRGEWVEFLDLVRQAPEIRSRLLFVPGNHDVNIVDRTNTGRFDLPWSVGHALRQLRFVVALDELQGERLQLVETGEAGRTLRSYLQDGKRPELLQQLAERGSRAGRREMGRVWDEIFPLVARPATPDGCGVILLDSNARSHFSLTNAIGVVNRTQLRRLKALLNGGPEQRWLILLHHHVVEYPIGSVALKDRIALSLVNAPDVLSAIAPRAANVVILHGHRHRDWIGTKGALVLCSAPSVALGSADDGLFRGSFHVNELALTGTAGMHLASLERVMIS